MVQGSGQMGELLGRRRRRRRRRCRRRRRPPATPRDINIGANMDRTIHYFQDRTEYGSYDPIFPGYEEVEQISFPIFPGYEEVEKPGFPIFPGL